MIIRTTKFFINFISLVVAFYLVYIGGKLFFSSLNNEYQEYKNAMSFLESQKQKSNSIILGLKDENDGESVINIDYDFEDEDTEESYFYYKAPDKDFDFSKVTDNLQKIANAVKGSVSVGFEEEGGEKFFVIKVRTSKVKGVGYVKKPNKKSKNKTRNNNRYKNVRTRNSGQVIERNTPPDSRSQYNSYYRNNYRGGRGYR